MQIKEQLGSQLKLIREQHRIKKQSFSMNRGVINSLEAGQSFNSFGLYCSELERLAGIKLHADIFTTVKPEQATSNQSSNGQNQEKE
jgi:fructose-bisphosphate aldolase class 1